MPASGCFAFGAEYGQFYDLSELGAMMIKAATKEARLVTKRHVSRKQIVGC